MSKEKCLKCLGIIDTNRDLFVLLGTYEGKKTVREDFFHMNCWRLYFEDKARQKAQAVVDGWQKRMMPVAKQMTQKLKSAIDHARDDEQGIYNR